MKRNVGNIDAIIRLIVAVIIVVLYYMGLVSGTLSIVLLIGAGIFTLTSFIGVCPLYLPFGINTRKKEHQN